MKFRDRVKELRRVKSSELLRNPKNWRTHSAEQAAALQGIFSEVGVAGAVIARELPGGALEIIDGHLRADTLPDDEVPVLVVDVDEHEAAKLLATFDPIGAMAGTDAVKLDALLREVETGTAELQELLANVASKAGLYSEADAKPQIAPEARDIVSEDPEPPREATTVKDNVPEPPREPVTKPGDLWLLGNHRLLCGDATKQDHIRRLMSYAKINVAFTSPPYARQRAYDESSGFTPIHPDEYVTWWQSIQANVLEHLASDGSFFVNIKEESSLEHGRNLYVRDLVIAHVRRWGWRFEDEFCNVFDPFCGSGTTLIASQQLGRTCFGTEISPAYCNVIIRRWEALTGEKAVLSRP